MKKKTIAASVATILFLSAASANVFAAEVKTVPPVEAQPTTILQPQTLLIAIDGTTIESAAPYCDEEVLMIPLASPLRALGYTVTWNNKERSVTLTKEKLETCVFIGENLYQPPRVKEMLNLTQGFPLEKAPVITNSITYVPVSFMEKVMNLEVSTSATGISLSEKADLNKEVTELTVNKGDAFTVSLQGNPTTGFTWSYETEPQKGLSLVKNESSVNSDLTGAPSTFIWSFQADEAGTYKLKYDYARSFENKTPEESITFTVTVQ